MLISTRYEVIRHPGYRWFGGWDYRLIAEVDWAREVIHPGLRVESLFLTRRGAERAARRALRHWQVYPIGGEASGNSA